jgi:ferritin-like metal-binding protein YciE
MQRMPTTKTLHDLFVSELRDAYDGEKQLTKALPKLAKGASSEQLREALTSHKEETEGHIARLEQVFQALDERPRGKHCAGLAGIIEEGADVLQEDAEPSAMDAAIIGSAQRAEHYEMAAYGTLIAWADVLELPQASKLLQEILDEEKAADRKLTDLAEAGINAMATEGESGEADEEDEERPAPRAKAAGAGGSSAKAGRR